MEKEFNYIIIVFLSSVLVIAVTSIVPLLSFNGH